MKNYLPSSKSNSTPRLSLFDVFWAIISPFIALLIRGNEFIDPTGLPKQIPATYEFAILTIVGSILIFIVFNVSRGVNYLFSANDVSSLLSSAIFSTVLAISLVFFVNRLEGIPRSVPIIYGLVLLVGLTLYRLFLRSFHEKRIAYFSANFMNRQDYIKKRILLIEVNSVAVNLIKFLNSLNPKTLQIVAVLTNDKSYSGQTIGGIEIIKISTGLSKLIYEYRVHGVNIDEIWVCSNKDILSDQNLSVIYAECRDAGIQMKNIYKAFNIPIADDVYEDDFAIALDDNQNKYFLFRRILDIICIFLISPIALIIVLMLMVIVIVNDGMPFLFWQQRLGRYGHSFFVYKIRTLRQPVAADGTVLSDDERMSIVGKFIRRTRLDELPQLMNILVGDMSLIGPRPLLPRDQPKDTKFRLLVRPGLTGWGQVNGNNLLTPQERDFLDCWYIMNACLKLDIIIILKTFQVVFFGVKRNEKEVLRAKEFIKSAM